jgi:hypothetical protein
LLGWLIRIVFVLQCVALIPAAHAQLQLNVPASCGNLPAFSARVNQLAGEHAVDRAHASVTVMPEPGGGFQLEVQLPSTLRRSQHADCRVLLDAAALIVALSVNPDLVQDALQNEPPAAPVVAVPQVPQVQAPARRWQIASHADVALLYGVLPAWSVPLSLGMRFSREKAGFGFALRYIPPRESDGTPRVQVQGFGGRLLAHYALKSWFEVALGVEADLLHGQGRAVPEARSDTTSRVAAKLELAFPLHLGARNTLALTTSAELAMRRGAFVVAGYGSVFTPELITFSVGARWLLSIL